MAFESNHQRMTLVRPGQTFTMATFPTVFARRAKFGWADKSHKVMLAR